MYYKYYRVIVGCGHVGKRRMIEITRYFEAENLLQCYDSAFFMPRSKKKPNCIKLIEEISFQEYLNGKKEEEINYYLNTYGTKSRMVG